MEWTNELTLQFLELYESQPIIWNPKLPEHKNRNKVADAWEEIKSSFSVECSVAELKKKKDSLMAIFRQLLSKVKASAHSGAGEDEVYKPNWFAYDIMSNFLRPVYYPRNTISTDEAEDNSINNPEQEREQVESPPCMTPVTRTSARKRKAERPILTVEAIENHLVKAANVMEKISNKPGKDYCSLYGELLATKLRALDEYNRTILMNQIDNLVFQTTINVKRSDTSPASSHSTPNYQYHNQSLVSTPQQSPSISIQSQSYIHQPSPSSSVHSQNYTFQQSPSSSVHSQNYTPQSSPASIPVHSQVYEPQPTHSTSVYSQNLSLSPQSGSQLDETVMCEREEINYKL